VLEKAGEDGTLLLRLPLGRPDAEYEVVVVVQPKEVPSGPTTPEERGWPAGYFENTYGSITDETFGRAAER
jgi:hypothetical protein